MNKQGQELFETGFQQINNELPEELVIKSLIVRSATEVLAEGNFKMVKIPPSNSGQSENPVLSFNPAFGAARVASKYLHHRPPHLRLGHIENIFRHIDTIGDAGIQREFAQIGAEIFNDDNTKTDAEVILTLVKILRKSGVENFVVELGHVGFENKAVEACTENGSNDEVKKIITRLPVLADVLSCQRIDSIAKNPKAIRSLQELEVICNILDGEGMGGYYHIDLGMKKSIDCFNGTIFRVLTSGVVPCICEGGRYNAKGNNIVGGTIFVNQVVMAIRHNANLQKFSNNFNESL